MHTLTNPTWLFTDMIFRTILQESESLLFLMFSWFAGFTKKNFISASYDSGKKVITQTIYSNCRASLCNNSLWPFKRWISRNKQHDDEAHGRGCSGVWSRSPGIQCTAVTSKEFWWHPKLVFNCESEGISIDDSQSGKIGI